MAKSPIALIAVLVFIPSLAFAQSDKALWDYANPLTWDDFQGTPGTYPDWYTGSQDVVAFITWGVDSSWAFDMPGTLPCEYTVTMVEPEAWLIKSESWVDLSTNNNATDTPESILNHEQRHLDIAQMAMYKFKNELLYQTFDCPAVDSTASDIDSAISDRLDDIIDEALAMELVYEDETEHGLNATKQLEWDNNIDAVLNQYIKYDFKKFIYNKISNWTDKDIKFTGLAEKAVQNGEGVRAQYLFQKASAHADIAALFENILCQDFGKCS